MLFSRTSFLKNLDSLLGPLLCQLLGMMTFLRGKTTDTKCIEKNNIHRILIIRPGGMGDMIILLPVIKLLKQQFSNAEIELVCEKRNMEALQIAGLTTVATAYDANPISCITRLIKKDYDIVIDTEQFHHFSAIFSVLSGAPIRIGFNINPRRNPLYTHLVNYTLDGSESLQFMNLTEPLGINRTNHKQGNISSHISTQTSALSEELQKFIKSKPFAIIHSGGHTPQKLWHPEKFIKLASAIFEKYNYNIILIGDKQDREIAEKIITGTQENGENIISSCGNLDLSTVVTLMRQAKIFIGTDSAPAHLAVALELPSVTIFGPSNHLKWGTSNEKHAIAKKDIPCSPCFIFGHHKPCGTIECMKNITPSDVLAAIDKVLSPSA